MGTVIFRDCVCLQNKLFFFIAEEAMPIRLDMDTGECTVLPIRNREEFRKRPFDMVTAIDNKIYALEMSGAYMCEYSLDTQCVRYIKINCEYKIDGNFALLQEENNNIYIFDRVKGVTIYNVQGDKLEKVPYPSTENEVITGCWFRGRYFLFPKAGNKVFIFDSSSKVWNIALLKTDIKQIVHAIANEEHIYVLTSDGTIIAWDGEEKVEIIKIARKKYGFDNAASRMCLIKNGFVVLPSLAEDILMIDKESNTLKIAEDYPNGFQYINAGWTKYAGYCETDGNYFFACRTSQYILKISKSDGRISWLRSEVDSAELYQREKKFGEIREQEGFLKIFLKDIIRENT